MRVGDPSHPDDVNANPTSRFSQRINIRLQPRSSFRDLPDELCQTPGARSLAS